MTSWRPYWCSKTMKRRPCWCPKQVLWDLNSFLMQTLSFVPINFHRCWPRDWRHSIAGILSRILCNLGTLNQLSVIGQHYWLILGHHVDPLISQYIDGHVDWHSVECRSTWSGISQYEVGIPMIWQVSNVSRISVVCWWNIGCNWPSYNIISELKCKNGQ